MNRVLVAFLVAFNLAIVIYMFHFYRIVNEVRQELKEEKEDTHRAERLQFRPLGKDEPIPRGMHVRINMQTGEREGRWLSDEDTNSNSVEETSIILSSTNDSNTDPNTFVYQNIDDDGQVKKKFRTYEELKKEMADLNLNVKTDAEILTQHMRRFSDLSNQHLTRENVDPPLCENSRPTGRRIEDRGMAHSFLDEQREETRLIIDELLEDGSDPEALYTIEHHLSADDFDTLEKVAVEAFKLGYEVTDAEELEVEGGETLMCCDAVSEIALQAELIDAQVEQLFTLAQRLGVNYDGWGTYFEDPDGEEEEGDEFDRDDEDGPADSDEVPATRH